MQQIDLEKWSEFKSVIDDIRNKYGRHEYIIGDYQIKSQSTVLFRGQQSAEWQLETTLERKSKENFSVGQYILKATRIVHEIESYTGTKWNLPDFPTWNKELEERQDSLFGPYLPCYDYLVYLRHHGYPSPLLDWSESPYIAAYFAMSAESNEEPIKDQRAAVYGYIDILDNTKDFDGGPIIQLKGPFVSTHKRHFIQKAWYTIASKWVEDKKQHMFCSHHLIFDKPNRQSDQDILIKITIPVSERKTALKDLDDYNINHFTLFQTEDSLIKALSMKIFDLSDD